MGGSQGAAALNERMPEAIARLGHVDGLEVVHQAGKDRDEPVRAAYERAGVTGAKVVAFIDDVVTALSEADLVVARAGASSLAEITAIGRAAILVPFPHAADDHQAKNAQALERAGGAVCLLQETADAARIAAEVGRLLADDHARVAMADASRAHGRPMAAAEIATDLLELAGIPRRSRGATNGAGRPHAAQGAP
jgi:UDP-N-acetylglucosamine--N-acetylmuramyl-(pentapeptide) pyrophosphoryl-undecaprenol N-acetylglucosamine transferase